MEAETETRLYRTSMSFNPFCFTDSRKKEKLIDKIRIYDNNGKIVYELDWFVARKGNSNAGELTEVILKQTAQRRLKEKFDGKLFYMSVKSDYAFDKCRVILYIPLKDLTIKEVSRGEVKGDTKTYDKVVYQVNNREIYFYQYKNERQTAENIKNQKIQELIENSPFKEQSYYIRQHFDKLKELVEAIEKIEAG